MNVLIIDNYDSFTFNLLQLAASVSKEVSVAVKRNDESTFAEIRDFGFTHIILSPGPGHPANQTDFGVCRDVIMNAVLLDCPILGVCLGHQGIAHCFGGNVTRAPRPVHGKTGRIRIIRESPLFAGFPEEFDAMRYHSLVVDEHELPSCLEVTARETAENLIMAIQHKELPLYGVQFHPESIGTPCGALLMKNFLQLTKTRSAVLC